MVKLLKTRVPGSEVEPEPSIKEVLKIIGRTMDGHKGEQLIGLDVSEFVDYLDYIIIGTGQTAIHNRAIVDYVAAELARYDIIPDGLNGYENGEWILVDFGVLTVHLFTPTLREFYRLEDLWSAGREVELM